MLATPHIATQRFTRQARSATVWFSFSLDKTKLLFVWVVAYKVLHTMTPDAAHTTLLTIGIVIQHKALHTVA